MGWRAVLTVLAAFPFLLEGELLPIKTYTTADGLAADHVDCIVPDSRGFLWFCTPEGLSRFDGYHFISYGVDEGLPHRVVSTLIETRSGDYLVGTARGFSRINPAGKGARFANYAPEHEAAQNSVRALLESRNGKIWCATLYSLFEWNRASGFRHTQLPLPPRTGIHSIVEDLGGDLWIGTDVGIYVLGESGVVKTFSRKDGLPGDWVERLLLDSQGRWWAALRGGLALISRRATGNWSVERTFTDKSGLVTWDVKALTEASDGRRLGQEYGS